MDNKNKTGIDNSGNWNTGNLNTGDWNSGHCNTGHYNTGDCNTGNRNTGDWNSGHCNTGNRNTGNWNTGNRNTGDWNTGNLNTGNRNTGDWNTGDWNSGYFNTDAPDKIRIFNTWVDMTHEEFHKKYNIYAGIPLNRWVDIKDIENPTTEQTHMGGYLKTLDFKEACQIWWNEHPDCHNDFLSLPNFDAAIFKKITGIDVATKTTMSDDELIAELERRGKVRDGKVIG